MSYETPVFTERFRVPYASAAAGTGLTTVLGELPYAAEVVEATIIPAADAAEHADNHRTFTLTNAGTDGDGTTAVAVYSTDSDADGSLAAGDEAALTLSATPANLQVAAGEVLTLVQTVGGTGVASSGGVVEVKVRRA